MKLFVEAMARLALQLRTAEAALTDMTVQRDAERQSYIRVCHEKAALVDDNVELRKHLESAHNDVHEESIVRERLSSLLTRIAAALKGLPPSGVWHDWSDLPQLASQLRDDLEGLRKTQRDLLAEQTALQGRIEQLLSRMTALQGMKS